MAEMKCRIYFNSMQNALNVQRILEVDASIPNAATVCDMVEVVRCKDCEYWQDNNGGYPHENCKWSADETPDANDFCSCGERKKKCFRHPVKIDIFTLM